MTPPPAIRYAANLSILFGEHPVAQRPGAAAEAGFAAVEMWWPFAEAVPGDRALETLRLSLADAGTRLVCLNFDGGDRLAGERGLVSIPGQTARFRANVAATVALAAQTGTPILNALYGNRVSGVEAAYQDDLAVENLAFAAQAAAPIGATIVVEALNRYDSPSYPLTSLRRAARVVDEVRRAGASNIGLLFDVYHLHRMGETDLSGAVVRYADRIAHVQFADAPLRSRPGTGDVPFRNVIGALRHIRYAGWVGLEYEPEQTSRNSAALAVRLLKQLEGEHP